MVSVRYCCHSAEGVHREVVQLPPSCLAQDVAAARVAAAQQLGLAAPDIELVYRGRTMDDTHSVTSYHVTSSSVIHAFRRPAPLTPAVVKPASDWDAVQLALTVKGATVSPYYRSVMDRVGRPEAVARLEASVPGLADDPGAVAILQEPALLLQLIDTAVARRVAARHPALAAATPQLSAILQDSPSPPRPTWQQHQPMDVEYEDGSDEEGPAAAGAETAAAAAAPAPVFTRQLLASALAAAYAGGGTGGSTSAGDGAGGSTAAAGDAGGAAVATAGGTSDPADSGGAAATGGVSRAAESAPAAPPAPAASDSAPISSEMVSAALREALSLVPAALPSTPAQQPPAEQPQVSEAAIRRLLEFGITDDEALVRQALQATNGNMDEAVEFLYSSL